MPQYTDTAATQNLLTADSCQRQGEADPSSNDRATKLGNDPSGNPSPTLSQSNKGWESANFKTKKKPVSHHLPSFSAWDVETAAITLSFVSFVTIIVVLRVYENRPQQAWPYNHLTLNGLVALLSTVTEGALFVAVGAAIGQTRWTWYTASHGMAAKGRPLEDLNTIDAASRGALGSMKLLWMTKGRHLVAIGALLSIMALAFDTFVQQVLTVKFRNAIVTNPSEEAYFPRSEYYSIANDLGELNIGGTYVAYTASVDMQAAIASGILAADVDDIAATCSTGNCTWPLIPTLAVCGSCTNVTDKLNTTCDDTAESCSNTLPSGLDLTLEFSDEFGLNSGNVVWFTSAPATTGAYTSGNIGAGANQPDHEEVSADPMYVANFEAINIPYFGGDGDYRQKATATQCALWFCVQAYNVSVTAGRQRQNTTGSWAKLKYFPEADATADAGPGTHRFVDIPESFNVAEGSQFTIDTPAVTTLQQAFNFSQSIQVVQYGNVAVPHVSSPSALGLWYGSQDWDAWIARLARCVSNDFRNSYATNLTAAPSYAGATYATMSFISVRWPWLAYPAAMLAMGVAFFVATICESHDRGVSAWKDGPLTLLAAGLDPDILEETRTSIHRPNGVAEACGGQRVVLDNNEGRLIFRQVQSPDDHKMEQNNLREASV